MTTETESQYQVFECGGCCQYHPKGFDGDCRDDANRLTDDVLDERYGRFGWMIVEEREKRSDCPQCGLPLADCEKYEAALCNRNDHAPECDGNCERLPDDRLSCVAGK